MIRKVIASGPYSDNWQSLSAYEVPRWFSAAKFGIFLHFGVYSVPAFGNEWYSRNMYIKGEPSYKHHQETYGPSFGYKDFIPLFKAEKFSADEWASLIAASGAKYAVPVAEHHDGFQMYASDLSHWNSFEMGPHHDFIGELSDALRKKDVIPCLSSHRAEHWWFFNGGRDWDSDVRNTQPGDIYYPAMPTGKPNDLFSKPYPDEAYLTDWLFRCCELVDKYKPGLIYFDWWIEHEAFKPYLKMFAAYYYNRAAEWGREVVITYKHDSCMFSSAVPDVERGHYANVMPFVWQSCTSTALNSWGYTTGNRFRTVSSLLCDLVDTVCKNGNLLLNAGPKSDGSFAEEDVAILSGIGRWMKVNGEALYGAKPFWFYGEGDVVNKEGAFSESNDCGYTSHDIRYTVSGGYLYAIALRPSADGCYTMKKLCWRDIDSEHGFHGIITKVECLGHEGQTTFTRDREGLHIKTCVITGDEPVVFRITQE